MGERHEADDTGGDNPLFVGVDAGGTKTLAVIVDARGVERGRGSAGSANLWVAGIAGAAAQLSQAATEAACAAQARLPLAAGWFGLSGLGCEADAEPLMPHLRTLARRILVGNDVELVLGALGEGPGVALIAGTGSIALARDAAGQSVKVGGWGHLVGDEGSGYDIGRRGLRAAARAADGRDPPTQLLELMLERFACAMPRDLVAQIYAPRSRSDEKALMASLAPLVLRAARAGDVTARRIVRQAAVELCLLGVSAIAALGPPGPPGPDAPPVSVALGGGLLAHEADLRASVLRGMRRRRRLGRVIVVREPALCAARALAISMLDGAPSLQSFRMP